MTFATEISFPDARGGRRPSAGPLELRIVRALRADDIPLLDAPPPGTTVVPPSTLQIRASHHHLAQCLVKGYDHTEASAVTGYTPGYISILMGDPAFQQLLATYQSRREAVFVDAMERMKTAGLSAMDELMHRLEDDPADWSKRELMSFQELCLGRGAAREGTQGGAVSQQVVVNVGFQTAQHEPLGDAKGPSAAPDTSAAQSARDLDWEDI